jgi:hypothetical protein
MASNVDPTSTFLPEGYRLGPIHSVSGGVPLTMGVIVRIKADPVQGSFVVLRDLPGSRVYLGAVADVQGRIQDWLEVWVQTLDLSDPGVAGARERLENHVLDERWRRDFDRCLAGFPDHLILTGMETQNPSPVLIRIGESRDGSPFAGSAPLPWRLCQDDRLLESLKLPTYSKSPFRYLQDPEQADAKTLLATHRDAPVNENVKGLELLTADAKDACVFNAQAGLVRIQRWMPLALEDYLGVLEGAPLGASGPGPLAVLRGSVYAGLQEWSKNPKGLPFLLHGSSPPGERLNEILCLKLSLLLDLFRAVRSYVRSQQLPLLNLTPEGFAVQIQDVGQAFPALWTARGSLVKTSQALPLELKGTDRRYFIRLGALQPSPFLPEELGAHSTGGGVVRLREVTAVSGGVVLDGTLVAEDYLKIKADDLLWLRLSVAEQALDLYAHADAEEGAGKKEIRFRTIPARLPEATVSALKSAVGAGFPRSPYEVWPMLSSPGDLYSLGVFAIRILLANARTRLAVVKDEVLSLSRRLGEAAGAEGDPVACLKQMLQQDAKLRDLLSPHALSGLDLTPEQAREMVSADLWWQVVCLVLRLFPGMGPHSYCQGLGDVAPLALETAFDGPLQDLEALVLRQRSVVLPSQMADAEIAAVLSECLQVP